MGARFPCYVLILCLSGAGGGSARAEGEEPTLLVERLANGLVVQIQRDDRAPVVAVVASYPAGTRFETAAQAGAAAALERAAFEGSKNVAAGEHRRLVASRGGRAGSELEEEALHLYDELPAGEIELGLWLEADRMRELASGLRPAVGAFATERMGPDGAVLTVVGDVQPERVWSAIEARFGEIPRRGAPPASTAANPPPAALLELPRGEGKMWLEWPCPPASDPASSALAVAAGLLGAGPGARLTERLVEDEGIAMSASAEHVALRGPGVLSIAIELSEGADPEAVRRSVGDVVAELAQRPPSADEMVRAERALERRRREGRSDALGWALQLGRMQMAGLSAKAKKDPVRPEDVQRAVDLVLVRRSPSVRLSRAPPSPDGDEGSP